MFYDVEDRIERSLIIALDTYPFAVNADVIDKILNTDDILKFIARTVITQEAKAISKAIEEKKSIQMPAFGSFRYSAIKEAIVDEKYRTLEEHGYRYFRDITDPEEREIIKQELIERCDKVGREEFLKRLPPKRVKTVDGFDKGKSQDILRREIA